MGGVSPVLYRLVVPARHAKIYTEVQYTAPFCCRSLSRYEKVPQERNTFAPHRAFRPGQAAEKQERKERAMGQKAIWNGDRFPIVHLARTGKDKQD